MDTLEAIFNRIDEVRIGRFAVWHFVLVGLLAWREAQCLRELRFVQPSGDTNFERGRAAGVKLGIWSRFLSWVALSACLLLGHVVFKVLITARVLLTSYRRAQNFAAGVAVGARESLQPSPSIVLAALFGAFHFVIQAGTLVLLVWLVRLN
jgi:hypothetical protein